MYFKLSSEELATLAFLFDKKLIKLEQLQRYYAYYIKKAHEVCPLLNQKLCGQMYANIVRNLYWQCKCKTLSKYLQNFFYFPCMEYFQCHVATYLQGLHIDGVLHVSEDELSYINLVVGLRCNGEYHTTSTSFLYTNLNQ